MGTFTRTSNDRGDSAEAPPRRRALTTVNSQLTAAIGLVLLVVLFLEGLTIAAHVNSHLALHVAIGMVLVPLVVVKIGTTTYRFARYYLGDPIYVDRGPPPLLLRLLGPVVVITSVTLLATGVGEAVLSPATRWAVIGHKASFVVWFGAMAIHVLGHVRKSFTLALGAGPRAVSTWVSCGVVLLAVLAGTGFGAWALNWTLTTGHG